MIDYIDNYKAKFITNGIVHAKKLIDKGLENYNTRYSFEKIKEVFVDGLEKSGVRI